MVVVVGKEFWRARICVVLPPWQVVSKSASADMVPGDYPITACCLAMDRLALGGLIANG